MSVISFLLIGLVLGFICWVILSAKKEANNINKNK